MLKIFRVCLCSFIWRTFWLPKGEKNFNVQKKTKTQQPWNKQFWTQIVLVFKFLLWELCKWLHNSIAKCLINLNIMFLITYKYVFNVSTKYVLIYWVFPCRKDTVGKRSVNEHECQIFCILTAFSQCLIQSVILLGPQLKNHFHVNAMQSCDCLKRLYLMQVLLWNGFLHLCWFDGSVTKSRNRFWFILVRIILFGQQLPVI